jgi:hypothetical protein
MAHSMILHSFSKQVYISGPTLSSDGRQFKEIQLGGHLDVDMPLLSGSLRTPKRSSSFRKFVQNSVTRDSITVMKIFELMRSDSTRRFIRTSKIEH